MIYHARTGERTFEIEVSGKLVLIDGEPAEVDLAHPKGTPVWSLRLDGASHHLVARRDGPGAWELHLRGHRREVEVEDERTRAIREMSAGSAAPAGPKPLVAPMPGLVVKVEVAEGEVVESGQGVIIVEAMKMENELRALGAGVVARVHVEEGQTVEKGQPLVDLDPLPAGG